jgi:hypothetical protein
MLTTKYIIRSTIVRQGLRPFAQRQNPFNIAESAEKIKKDESRASPDLFNKDQMEQSRMTI